MYAKTRLSIYPLEMVNLIILFDIIDQKPAIKKKQKKMVWKSDIYWLHTSDAIGHDLRKITCTFQWRVALS